MTTDKITIEVEPLKNSDEFYYFKFKANHDEEVSLIVDKENLRVVLSSIDNAII